MDFQIPELDQLSRFTVTALRELGLEAAANYDTLMTEYRANPDAVSDESLDYLEDLNAFTIAVDAEIASRGKRSKRLAKLDETTFANKGGDVEAAEDAEEDEDEEADVPAAKSKAPATVVASSEVVVPSLSDIAAGSTQTHNEISETIDPELAKFTLRASPDVGYAAGTELESWLEVAKAFQHRTASYRGASSVQQHGVALIERDFGDFALAETDSDEVIYNKFESLRDERRLEGGSLVAGVGWCAPSETIYTTCSQVTIDGIFSAPEIGARRGGIRHNTGIEFDAIFGAGTGFNILTEAQVISDTVKTCVAVPCPSFVDDRLKVAVLCLTGDILQNRGYPEFVSTFIQGAISVQAHNVNRQIIADVVTGSTAVSLLGEPFLSDGSVVSNVMSGVDLAVTDIKYRLRLRQNATVEIVLPFWLKAQMRADWIRRNAVNDPNLADAAISAMFSARDASVQWVYDWQDSFSGVAGNPGDDTPITSLPLSVKFLAYPAGTWVVARQDVIRLDSIYDSTNITTNKVTQLFMEDGFRAMQFCPLSRVYTIAICPSGATGIQREVDCVTP